MNSWLHHGNEASFYHPCEQSLEQTQNCNPSGKGGKANAIIVTFCALPDPAVFSIQVVCYGVAEKPQGVNKKEQLGGMGIW